MLEPSLSHDDGFYVDDDKVWMRLDTGSGSYWAPMLLWTSLGHDSGGASDSVLRGGGFWVCGCTLTRR